MSVARSWRHCFLFSSKKKSCRKRRKLRAPDEKLGNCVNAGCYQHHQIISRKVKCQGKSVYPEGKRLRVFLGGVSKLRKHQFLNDKNKVQVGKKVYCSRKTIKMTF